MKYKSIEMNNEVRKQKNKNKQIIRIYMQQKEKVLKVNE